MAKIFIETYTGLQDGKLGALPLIRSPTLRNTELTIPTDAATIPGWLLNPNESVIRVVPRDNCGLFFKGWAEGAAESTATEGGLMTLTGNSPEYFGTPKRIDGWFNVKLFIRNDLS